jgi:3-dehydroquinate synthase
VSLITITSNIRDYTVSFPESFEFLRDLEQYQERCYAIDQNVWRLYSEGPLKDLRHSDVIVLPVEEELKSLESVQKLYDYLLQRNAKRNLTLVSIGGGILQDISGFAASTLYRGINWVFIPTTLLAQADSCIGAKTSLNYKAFKNLIGTFYPPSQVLVHTPFLLTQEDVDFYSGLGEVVKLHMIGGTESMHRIIEALPAIIGREPDALLESVRSSLLIKKGFITEDEFDTGTRNMLNFGHCFGHAIESAARYEIPHGQAVVLGMLLANIVARQRGLLSDEFHQFIARELLLPSLVVKVRNDYFDRASVIEGMKKDKKRTGIGLALVMMGDNNQMCRVNDLTEQEAGKALDVASDQLRES